MTKREKKIIFTIIGIMIVVILALLIIEGRNKQQENDNDNVKEKNYVVELENGVKVNVSEDTYIKKKYKTLEISNIQYTSTNGSTTILAVAQNKGETDFEEEIVNVVLLNPKGEVIKTVSGYIPNIEVGQEKELNFMFTAEIVNIKDFKIEGK